MRERYICSDDMSGRIIGIGQVNLVELSSAWRYSDRILVRLNANELNSFDSQSPELE